MPIGSNSFSTKEALQDGEAYLNALLQGKARICHADHDGPTNHCRRNLRVFAGNGFNGHPASQYGTPSPAFRAP
jgi:hypothetical protein